MSHLALPRYVRRSCRWTNDREFCASVERRHFKILGGALGALLARQTEAHGEDYGMPALGRAHAGLPDDLLNFHFDPLACAVAAGWDGASVEESKFGAREEGGVLTFTEEPGGRKTRVVSDVDGPRLEEEWLQVVAAV